MKPHPEMIKLIPKLSEESQLELVKKNAEALEYVTSYKVMLQTISRAPYSIYLIQDKLNNLDEKDQFEIILAGVKKWPGMLSFVTKIVKEMRNEKYKVEILMNSVSKNNLVFSSVETIVNTIKNENDRQKILRAHKML